MDDYRWLEDGRSEAVQHWVASQNAYTRSVLDRSPYREAMKRDILAQLRKSSITYSDMIPRHGVFFMLKRDPSKQQPTLVMTRSLYDRSQEKTLVDPNALNSGGHLSIDWYKASLDGALVAVAMSEGGSEDSSLYIYDVEAAKQTSEVVPRVSYPTGGGSMTWLADRRSFPYTRYPQGTERPAADINFNQQIWLHRIGTPASQDTYVLGKEFPRR